MTNETTHKILIIDDEEMLRHLLMDILTERGFAVEAAANGREGLAILTENDDFDLILLDIQMPGMSGYEVLKKIRRINHDIRIIILSAYDVRGREHDPRSMQIFEYLHKPVSIGRLLNTIEQAFQLD